MIKKLVILFCFISVKSIAQDYQTIEGLDNKTYRFTGKVYKITEVSYDLTDTSDYLHRNLYYGFYGNSENCVIATFSKNGEIIQEKYITCGDTNEYDLWKYEYSKNKSIKYLKHSTNIDTIGETIYYVYDKKKRLISTGEEMDPYKNRYQIVYSSKPEMKQENFYDINGNLRLRYEYIYENGKQIEFRHYKNGHFYKKNWGDKQSEVKNNDSLVLLYRNVYDYDKKGRERKMIRIDEEYEDRDDSTIYIYNNEGQKIESIGYDSKGAFSKYEMQHDKFGNETLEKYIQLRNNVSDITSYEYTYDTNNNWIKKIIYLNQTPIFKVERTIIYYE